MNNKSKVVAVINLIKEEQKKFFTILGIIVGIAILTVFIVVRINVVNSAASDKVFIATSYLMQNKIDEGLAALDDVIAKYPSSPASYRAMIMRANNYYSSKEYEQAKAMAEVIVSKAKPASVRLLAYPLLIAINEETGNIKEAISLSQKFIDENQGHFLVPAVTENMARLYAVSGNNEEADKIYKQIKEKYGDTVYSQRAELKVSSASESK